VTDAVDVIAMTEPILGKNISVASAEEAAQPTLERLTSLLTVSGRACWR